MDQWLESRYNSVPHNSQDSEAVAPLTEDFRDLTSEVDDETALILVTAVQSTSRHFTGLKETELAKLVRLIPVVHTHVPVVFSQDTQARCVGLLLYGDLKVHAHGKDIFIQAGEIIGEHSIFADGLRTMDVLLASSEAVLALFPLEDFFALEPASSLAQGDPDLSLKILRMFGTSAIHRAHYRLRLTEQEVIPCELEPVPQEMLPKLQILRKGNDQLDLTMTDDHLAIIAQEFLYCRMDNAKQFLSRDDKAQYVFFILSGEVKLEVEKKMVGRRMKGEFIGEELYLLRSYRHQPATRSEDVSAIYGTELLVFDFDRLDQVQRKYPEVAQLLLMRIGGAIISRYSVPTQAHSPEPAKVGHEKDVEGAVQAGISADVGLRGWPLFWQMCEQEAASTDLMLLKVEAEKAGDQTGAAHGKELLGEEERIIKNARRCGKNEALELLQYCRCFSGFFQLFSAEEIVVLAEELHVISLPKGGCILCKGEEATFVGIVVSGLAEVIIDGVHVCDSQVGEIIGEMALFAGQRVASVLAKSAHTAIGVWPLKRIMLFMKKHPIIGMKLLQGFIYISANKLRRVSDDKGSSEEKYIRAMELLPIKQLRKNLIKGSLTSETPFTMRLPLPPTLNAFLENMASLMKVAKVPKGTVMYEKGYEASGAALVLAGEMEVELRGVSKAHPSIKFQRKTVGMMVGEGTFLLESSIIRQLRIECVTAVSDAVVGFVTMDLLEQLLGEHPRFVMDLYKACVAQYMEDLAVSLAAAEGTQHKHQPHKHKKPRGRQRGSSTFKKAGRNFSMMTPKKRVVKSSSFLQILRAEEPPAFQRSPWKAAKWDSDEVCAALRGAPSLVELGHAGGATLMTHLAEATTVIALTPKNMGKLLSLADECIVIVLAKDLQVALPAHPQATWSRGTGSFLAPQQFLYGLPSPCIYHAAEEAHVGAIPPTELLDIIQEHPLGGLTLITTMLRQAVEEAAEHLRPSPPLALASSTMSLTEVMPIVLKAHQATGCFGALPGPSESHVKMLRILLQAAHFRKVGWRQCVMRRGCRFLEVVIVLHGTLQMRAGAAKSPVLGELQIGSFLGSAAWLHDPQVECPEEVYAGDGDDGALLAQLPLAALELLNKEHPYIARPLFFAMAAKEVDAQLRRLSPCLQMPKPDEVEVQKMQHLLAMSEVEKAEIGRQFRGFGDEELRQLEKCVDLWLFQEGQFVWSSTLRDRWVGVVVQGSALVLRDGKQVGSLQVGDLLGEITSFVETRLEPAKVVGEAGDCMVAAFRWDQLEALHEQNPELGLQMLRLVFGTAARKLGCLRGLCDANGLTARTDMINTELIPATKLFLMLQVACSAQWKKKIGARADQILRLHHLYDLALHMHTVAFKAGDLASPHLDAPSYAISFWGKADRVG
ncbi:hypothetical protein CYMTET_51957 [Cymbomonas tetramitiformis]|uniref:Cyclic nucleotide-binding domain-containing protein n=1 Tax=Cymbomonas tetramitiformis TaxID=36881 RepID=A0AAE0ET63_9CHLO|nr:hypothetical protein CYMTET_51957 [Cymbomonas tetramitiformis]